MGKPVDSPASFGPISLTSRTSKLLERIILSHLFFFLKSNFIPLSLPGRFLPSTSTLDQIFYLSQSISDGFKKPKPCSQTILAIIDFSKAIDSAWHPALSYKFISADLTPCCAHWTQFFPFDKHACMVIKITTVATFLALYFSLFLSMIFLLLCILRQLLSLC